MDRDELDLSETGLQLRVCESSLKFTIDDNPPWRSRQKGTDPNSLKQSCFTTTEMLREVVEMIKRFYDTGKTPLKARDFAEREFARARAIDFVYHSNIGESIGLKSHEGTKEVLQNYLEKGNLPTERGTRETIQTYEALTFFYELSIDPDMAPGWVTVQQIQDAHRKLLATIYECPGEIRKRHAYTTYKEEEYYHPPPEKLQALFYACIDRHNIHMDQLDIKRLQGELKDPFNKTDDFNNLCERLGMVFKSAAWLMFNFVDVHPFGDGNGRLCRLLANYVLGTVTPFPVPIYLGEVPGQIKWEDYLDAIVKCRESEMKHPGQLTSMLVENAWKGWKRLFDTLKRMDFLKDVIEWGPIVLQIDKRHPPHERMIRDKMSHLKLLDAEKEEMHSKIVSEVKEAIDEVTDKVFCLAPGKYLQLDIKLKCKPKHCVQLQLYPSMMN